MANHEQVAKAFINGKAAKGFAMFTSNHKVFSYGEHFLIAKQVLPEVVLFNADGYSVSTAKHKTLVRRVIPANWLLEVPNLRPDTDLTNQDTLKAVLDYHTDKAAEAALKHKRAKVEWSKQAHLQTAVYHGEQYTRAKAFAEALKAAKC